ncbi:phytanoyl-CoA dioxygenase family protein [Roseococcus sp.]|uniref:phytanoyl-CoA dioxygenase family protein n=1 Tax=Roseococcus sp. TaxID=2109646 RepID=UPI003BABFB0E
MGKVLDDMAIARYRRDGYVTPIQGVSAEQAEAWHQDVRRCCGEAERPVSDTGIRQPSTRVKPYLLFPWAADLVRHPAILDAVEDVIGPDILIFHTTLWWKAAGTEGFVPWHQDATYFGLAPHEHVTAWLALTPSTLESGCVTVLPGSHKHGQLPHADRKDPRVMLSRGQSVAVEVEERAAVPILLQPGQFSLHDTLALHSSAPNRSNHDRIGLGISYIPARVKHVGPTRLSATLVRGENRHDHFDLEARPRAEADAAARATHADSIGRFWIASESIPEMKLVH